MDESVLTELFATPPPEFVAARNSVAKALRAEKRRDEASAVAALRRPGWDDWALNVVAADRSGPVGAFADAAEAVREAQAAAIEGREGPDVRAALRELRDASAQLVERAGEVLQGAGRQPAGPEVNARLGEVATSAQAIAALRAGVLGSGADDGDDLFAGLRPADRPAPRRASRRAEPAPSTRQEPRADPKADAAADRADRQRRREVLAAATRGQRAARKALQRAESNVAAATEDVARAERALAAAGSDREQAAEALDAADAALEAARAEP